MYICTYIHIYTKSLCIHACGYMCKNIYKSARIFTELFLGAKPKSISSRINKLWHNHLMEYNTPRKINHSSMQNMCEYQHTAEGKKIHRNKNILYKPFIFI